VPGLDQASGAGRGKCASCGVGGLGRLLVSWTEVMVSMHLLHTLRYALILSYRCHVTRNFHEIGKLHTFNILYPSLVDILLDVHAVRKTRILLFSRKH
jgi:hypothetical protein